MMGRTHWGWVLLLMLVAAAAVMVNAGSRRVFILHEGRAGQPVAQAFLAAADGVLRRSSHLKARHQYLDGRLENCRKALVQLAAFNPDVVIAEGLQARHCMARRDADRVHVVVDPATQIRGQAHSAFVAAWAAVLEDLSSPAAAVTLLYGDDADGQAERDLLIQAASLAGRELQTVAIATDRPRVSVTGLGTPDNPVLVGHTVGDGASAGRDLALRAVFDALHAATPQPIMATRLDRVFLGADMALDQAPEQRGEQMALKALRGLPADRVVPPLEMAVALRSEFAQRMGSALPPFYLASARLSGFLATAENRASAQPRVASAAAR